MTANIERVSFARVLIETDITQQLPQELYIEKPDGTLITQAIKYEWTPQFCHTCMKMENKEGECKHGKPTQPVIHLARRK